MSDLRRLIEQVVREMLGNDAPDVLAGVRRLVRGGAISAGSLSGTLPTPTQQAIDHGNLAGLADDDHGQYLTTTRHDVTARHGAAVLGTGTPDETTYLRGDGTWQTVVTGTQDHDHSGDAGDGGTFDAANLGSGAATFGYVLMADGAGGAAWEAVAVVDGGSAAAEPTSTLDGGSATG